MLKERAKRNTQVSKGISKNQNILKEGIPNDHSNKHFSEVPTVGLSVGTTLNMGDYESLRVDTWISDKVSDNETFEQAYKRLTVEAQKALMELIETYRDE